MKTIQFAAAQPATELAAAIADLSHSLRYALRWRRMARSLARLDDQMLRDVGVARYDIDDFARGVVAARMGARPAIGPAMTALAAGLRRAVARWSERRRQMQALHRLDDRLLRDVGLTRAMVRAADLGARLADDDATAVAGARIAARLVALDPAPLRHDQVPATADTANENRLRRAS